MMTLLVSLLVMNKAHSANPVDRSNSSYDYGTYWKMNSGTYNYDVVFYENSSDPNRTMAGRFPFTLSDGTVINSKEDLINIIVIPAMNAFNVINTGLTFNYSGTHTTSSDINAFSSADSDTKSEIEVAWRSSGYTYLNLSIQNEFGFLFGSHEGVPKSNWIYSARHEMLHCLGFSHKVENYYGFGNPNWYPSSTGDGNFSDRAPFSTIATGLIDPALYWNGCSDTLHGLNIVYGIGGEDLKVEGYVTNYYSDGYAEAYLVDSVTTKIFYQAPVDKTGKFEFRIKPIPPNPMKILACDSHINKNYSVVAGTDNNTYLCKLDHTSTDDNKPITGANWSTYWVITTTAQRNAWETGKNYKKMFSNMRFQFTGNLPIPPGANYYNAGNISLDRTASTVEGIQATSGIKMVYP